MAYNDFGFNSALETQTEGGERIHFKAGPDTIVLPDSSYIRDAELMRDGADLVLQADRGQVIVENYFSGENQPLLTGSDNAVLTPDLVDSFVKSSPQYASNLSASDETPVGLVDELMGKATVTRTDGSVETIQMNTEIYQGDIVETTSDGAINITFTDESSFAVSEGARLAIDEYVFDPSTESGQTDFSVLKGVFVYTSGLIGRDDPDDVSIDTPVGSIGIRGTIIAGDVGSGEITVVEGAIVLRDFSGNEVTLANQFETAQFDVDGAGIKHMGELSAHDVVSKFVSVSNVAPTLFSSIDDSAVEQGSRTETGREQSQEDAPVEQDIETKDEAPAKEVLPEVEVRAEETSSDTEPAKTDSKNASSETSETVKVDTSSEAKPLMMAEASDRADAKVEKYTQKVEHYEEKLQKALEQGNEKKAVKIRSRIEVLEDKLDYIEQKGVFELSKSSLEFTEDLPEGYGFIAKQGSIAEPTTVFKLQIDQLFAGDEDGKTVYELSDRTEKALDQLIDTALDKRESINGKTVLLGNGRGWEFYSETGELLFYINEVSEFKAAFGDDNLDIDLEIRAKNSGEEWSDFESFSIKAYGGDESAPSDILYTNQYEAGDTVYQEHVETQISGSEELNIFVADGEGEIVLKALQHATIFTGEGIKTVKIGEGGKDNSAITDNTIIGGNDADSFDKVKVHNADNDVYTFDGNDQVKLYVDEVHSQLTDGIERTIDGGSGDDRFTFYNEAGGSDSVDFSALDTHIENFETIKFWNADTSARFKLEGLTLDDVVTMTDEDNELVFEHEGGEVEIALGDDWVSHGDTNDDGYAEYTGTASGGEEVTLLVDADIIVA